MRVLVASFCMLLAACGFQPMYAPPGGGPAFGSITVAQIDGKAGHVLKSELDRIFAPEANTTPPALLEITLQEYVVPFGLRLDESATRGELRLVANYVLTPPNNGRIMRGSVVSVVNYDIPTAAFGEIASQDDARERAAESLAQRFRSEIALRLAQARQAR